MAQSTSTLLGLNKSSLLTIAGIAGAAFVGYAIYFDHKRRSDPEYKQRIREKRRAKARGPGARVGGGGGAGLDSESDLPDPRNPTQMQSYFLQEVQLGEELMSAGNTEEGALHIANAIVLCGQSQQLLSIFQQTLPPEQFNAVLAVLPTARERLADHFGINEETLETNNEQHTDARLSQAYDSAADFVEAAGAGGDGAPIMQFMGGNDDTDAPVQIRELIDDELE
ncbi:unnamed protein product, partial [Mesorhabditis belari]|uniref:Mitochondrial import receptor subunit TOM20 homolog n=1 Tax=Mesorhabditis belari TaxID=2138241 RepID=A0AAF3FR93_9BILA